MVSSAPPRVTDHSCLRLLPTPRRVGTEPREPVIPPLKRLTTRGIRIGLCTCRRILPLWVERDEGGIDSFDDRRGLAPPPPPCLAPGRGAPMSSISGGAAAAERRTPTGRPLPPLPASFLGSPFLPAAAPRPPGRLRW